MSTLAGVGPIAWALRDPDDWAQWTSELSGYWLVDTRRDKVVTCGHHAPNPATATSVQYRLLSEQLFDLAVTAGVVPWPNC